MQLTDSASDAGFRDELRAFLADNWIGQESRAPDRVAAFRRLATEAGYLYRRVPVKYGGSEQPVDVMKAQIIREEFAAARAPMEVEGNGMNMLVPTLLEKGTDAQRDFFLRPTIEGRFIWAQGYSESESGSDLASLKTRAELVGDEWVINGAKIWTSHAEKARYMFALVRTEPDGGKHGGISYLLLDLKQPGVTVRPFREITGQDRFSEIIFDNAKTPADWIVGKRGEGWLVSRTTLKHERASIGSAKKSEDLLAKLIKLARKPGKDNRAPIDDAAIRQRLATLQGWVMAQKYSSYRQLSLAADGQEPGLMGLLDKLLSTEIGHDTAKLAEDLIGDAIFRQPLAPAPGVRRGEEKWLDQIMGSIGVSIAGGTSNIQRNVIAERGLGLPRDPAIQN